MIRNDGPVRLHPSSLQSIILENVRGNLMDITLFILEVVVDGPISHAQYGVKWQRSNLLILSYFHRSSSMPFGKSSLVLNFTLTRGMLPKWTYLPAIHYFENITFLLCIYENII